jgi:sulfhydrogenase subunit beta (sulfur reductase)
MGCDTPCDTCFCTAVGGSPFGKEGVDVQITSMGDDYLFEAVTKRGQALIDDLPQAEPGQVTKLKQVQNQSIAGMQKPFDSTGLRDHLYAMFEDKYWREVSQSCLGCGVCTFLCPSCFCFDIVDEVLRDERVRNWDTCMFRVYSLEASGHNPRPTKAERTRQRVMHKFAYWVDLVDGFGCTGCGRCVINCPVNLDIRQMVRGAQAVKVKAEVGK